MGQSIHMFYNSHQGQVWGSAPLAHLHSEASWPATVHPSPQRRCSSWRCWDGCTGSLLESLSVWMQKDSMWDYFLYNPLSNATMITFIPTSCGACCKVQTVNRGMHICWTHQQFIHAGLAFFQVYSLYGDTLLSRDTEGCLHHSCGPTAWNHDHNTAMTK